MGLNERDGRRAGRWREHGRDEGAGGLAREPCACAVLSRGRQTAYRENRVLLKTAWRGVTSRERIGRGCGKQCAAEAHPLEPLLGDAACALQDALRGAQRACTLVVQLLELRQPGRRVHAPPGEQFVERGVLRALIPRFI